MDLKSREKEILSHNALRTTAYKDQTKNSSSKKQNRPSNGEKHGLKTSAAKATLVPKLHSSGKKVSDSMHTKNGGAHYQTTKNISAASNLNTTMPTMPKLLIDLAAPSTGGSSDCFKQQISSRVTGPSIQIVETLDVLENGQKEIRTRKLLDKQAQSSMTVDSHAKTSRKTKDAQATRNPTIQSSLPTKESISSKKQLYTSHQHHPDMMVPKVQK